jgi:hypothetical protein
VPPGDCLSPASYVVGRRRHSARTTFLRELFAFARHKFERCRVTLKSRQSRTTTVPFGFLRRSSRRCIVYPRARTVSATTRSTSAASEQIPTSTRTSAALRPHARPRLDKDWRVKATQHHAPCERLLAEARSNRDQKALGDNPTSELAGISPTTCSSNTDSRNPTKRVARTRSSSMTCRERERLATDNNEEFARPRSITRERALCAQS